MSARAILIAGPTASGKSALAIRLAKAVGGAVVNADSMQVYRDLRILTARPTLAEEAEVEHRLFGHVDAGVNYSVGRYLADLGATLAELAARNVTPILAGGTGMYFKAALHGLSDIPAVPEDIRAAVRAAAEGRTPQDLHADLSVKDPQTAARLRPTDPQRILRALEVFAATGKPLASFQGPRSAPPLDAAACTGVFVAPERETLYTRIDARFEKMMAEGALVEVDALRGRRLDPTLPAMRAHGVPHLIRHLNGEMSFEDAVAAGQRDTRHYAKRQFTFARHQLPDFTWLSGADMWTALESARVVACR